MAMNGLVLDLRLNKAVHKILHMFLVCIVAFNKPLQITFAISPNELPIFTLYMSAGIISSKYALYM